MDVGELFVAGDGSLVGVEPADGIRQRRGQNGGLLSPLDRRTHHLAVLPIGREQFEAIFGEGVAQKVGVVGPVEDQRRDKAVEQAGRDVGDGGMDEVDFGLVG